MKHSVDDLVPRKYVEDMKRVHVLLINSSMTNILSVFLLFAKIRFLIGKTYLEKLEWKYGRETRSYVSIHLAR